MPRINILYKFSIQLFIITLIVIMAMGIIITNYIISYYFQEIMMRRELKMTADFVQTHAQNWLEPENFLPPFTDDTQAKFSKVFHGIVTIRDVVSLKVYDARATIIWSDRRELIGKNFMQNKEYQQAMKGEPVIVLEPIRRVDHAYLAELHTHLLEVYVPITLDAKSKTVSGVLATYKTATSLMGDIKKGKTIIWVVSLGAGLLLYILVFIMFYRGYKKEEIMTNNLYRLNEELSSFNRIAIVLSSSLDINTILHDSMEKTLNVLHKGAGRIFLLDETSNELVLAAHKGLPDDVVSAFKRVKVKEGILKDVIDGKKPLLMPEMEGHYCVKRFMPADINTWACATIPIMSMDKVLGIMEIMCPGGGCNLPMESQELFSAIGHQIGDAVAKCNLFKEIKDMKENLENLVEERTRQVIQMEKLSSIGEIMGEIAHQINNPLVGVLNFAQLALRKIDEGQPIREEVETIEKAGTECKDIIQRLLTFSKKSRFEKSREDINCILNEGIALVERQFNLKGIIVEKKYAEELPKVMIDATLMRQAFFNLINNARQAMPNGGELTIATSAVSNPSYVRWVEIRISDTGVGIKKENLPKIFTPFFTTKREGEGIGLGVFVVHNIIKRHTGDIHVESEEGGGTTFIIKLPI
ncbi:MAG: hypothetical protein A2073_01235 [Deltaproteobacteria bacterium GWC2_42_11]|nr:MAG: hypothetical protein A2073_01235 [Deltaproteobacteria bacterium GWC2_42_11]